MSVLRGDGSRRAEPNQYGIIELQAYSDCNSAYSGSHRTETVYLVGHGTEHERIFLSSEAKQAIAYKNETSAGLPKSERLHLDQVAAGQLCAKAVDDLYAAAAAP